MNQLHPQLELTAEEMEAMIANLRLSVLETNKQIDEMHAETEAEIVPHIQALNEATEQLDVAVTSLEASEQTASDELDILMLQYAAVLTAEELASDEAEVLQTEN